MYEDQKRPPYTVSDTRTSQPTYETTFFGKVMFFFGLAIMTSALGTYTTMTYFMEYFLVIPNLMWILFAAELGLIFTSRWWSQKAPINRVLFVLFAFITGVTIAPLISIVLGSAAGTTIFLKALAATTFMFIAIAVIGSRTSYDLSWLRKFLIAGVIGLIGVAILGAFFPWGSTMEMVYTGAGVLIFGAFTMYDFQKLKSYPEDRYIDAALAIYLDIFNLFLFVLRFMLAFSGRD